MSNWITSPASLDDLAAQVDNALSEIERMAKRAYVSNEYLPNSTRSYLFTDDGVLKFHNVTTNTISTVDLT